MTTVDTAVRCPWCSKKLSGYLNGELDIFCRGCKRFLKLVMKEFDKYARVRVES